MCQEIAYVQQTKSFFSRLFCYYVSAANIVKTKKKKKGLLGAGGGGKGRSARVIGGGIKMEVGRGIRG